VAVDEIESETNHVFGDNDTLSAIVATLVNADLLIILSILTDFMTVTREPMSVQTYFGD